MSIFDGEPSIPKRQVGEAILAALRTLPGWAAKRLAPIPLDMLREDASLDLIPADFLRAATNTAWMDGALRGIGWKYEPVSRTFTRI